MQTATALPSTLPANHGSRTMTITPSVVPEAGPSSSSDDQIADNERTSDHTIGVLKLRGGPVRRQRVVWSPGTVDNEGMGKKKSKICCIYHKPKAYDESSSESETSSSGSESDSNDAPASSLSRSGANNAMRRRDGNGGLEEEEESSESEGGRGGGSAKPARKSQPKRHRHRHAPDCEHGHGSTPKPNKYDHQGQQGGGGEKAKRIT